MRREAEKHASVLLSTHKRMASRFVSRFRSQFFCFFALDFLLPQTVFCPLDDKKLHLITHWLDPILTRIWYHIMSRKLIIWVTFHFFLNSAHAELAMKFSSWSSQEALFTRGNGLRVKNHLDSIEKANLSCFLWIRVWFSKVKGLQKNWDWHWTCNW